MSPSRHGSVDRSGALGGLQLVDVEQRSSMHGLSWPVLPDVQFVVDLLVVQQANLGLPCPVLAKVSLQSGSPLLLQALRHEDAYLIVQSSDEWQQ